MKKIIYLLVILIMPLSIEAQKVFIDQPIRIGEFIVFPTVDDPNVYHYFPGNPRIAKTKDGKPQFSFLLYTEKNRSKAGAVSIEQQAGGGLVHALVEYGLTNAEVEKLRRLLKVKNKSAILKGPVMFKSGTIALKSAVANSEGGYVDKIIGVGKAPILEGNKAAIAFMLNKKGAQILWATFQTPTPDISFSFEMEMAGYLSPIKGYVKGNFKDVYEAHDMSLGVSGGIGPISLGAEIGATLDKLEKDGKIEVYTEGDDKERDKLIAYGYKKLVDMLFVSTDESYNQMVNNNPAQKESGFDKLEELNKLQSKFNTDPEKGENYEEHKKKRATPTMRKPKSQKSPTEKGVIDPEEDPEEDGGDNKLGYLNNKNKEKLFYFKKHAGGASVGKVYSLDFFKNILELSNFQDRSLYENKHNDLINLKYSERWTNNNPVKVSKKHIIAVLNNYKDAQYESKNNTLKGRKWIQFYPRKANVKEVAMEAWRFRGLVEMTYKDNIRNNLTRALLGNYLNKHDDFLKFKYTDRWRNKISGNQIFSVSKRHAIAILKNYKSALIESRNNKSFGVEWISFNPPKGEVRTVSMESWRFRGFVELCNTSEKYRVNLRRALGVEDSNVESATRTKKDGLARDVDDAFEEFDNNDSEKNDVELGPAVKISAGSHLLADLDDWDAETANTYYKNNKDLVLIKIKGEFVKNKKLLLDDNYILVSKEHLITIFDDCNGALIDKEDFVFFTYNPSSEYYNSFKIDTWRYNAIVKSYCSNKRNRQLILDNNNDKLVIKSKDSDNKYGRHLVINKDQLLFIFNNLLEAQNEESYYTENIKRELLKPQAVYKFGIFGKMEPNQFMKAVDLCSNEKDFNAVIKKSNEIKKGGPNPDNYFNYNDYLNKLSEKEFLNQIPIVNSTGLVKGTPMGISIYASYKYRKTKKEGTYKLEFKKVKAETRHLRFDENIGNILKECKKCFNVVSLDEMKHFKQREVLALLDGAVLSNFNNFINSASIQLKKIRSNGPNELDDATIKYTDFNKVGDIDKKVTGNIRKLVYGWKNDKDETWGNYKYKIDWTYFSNLKIPGEWKDADANVITVSSPLNLKTLTIEADPDFAQENGIKYIIVNIEYPYGDKMQRGYVDFDDGGKFIHKVIKLKPSSGILSKKIGVILPNDVDEVSYTYTVITKDNEEFTSKPKKAKGLYIYGIDRIPKGK